MIEWLVQRAVDDPLVAAGLPPENLLSAPETAVFDNLHSIKRRQDWLLGRWTAKKLIQAAEAKSGQDPLSCDEISILAAKDGAPEVWLNEDNQFIRADYGVSISHSHNVSLCATISTASYQVGADIEAIEPRSPRFIDDYFTESEIELVRQAPEANKDCLVTALWSGKEAALKAVRQGLRVDTRAVSCVFDIPLDLADEWHPFAVRYRKSQPEQLFSIMNGWYRIWQKFVLTMVVAAKPDQPHRQ